MFEDALDKLQITLHPRTRHRATYSQDGSANPIVEPTPVLCCPIEGGDYVFDETGGARGDARSGCHGAGLCTAGYRVSWTPWFGRVFSL